MPLFKSWLTIWEISQSFKFGERHENPNPPLPSKKVAVMKIVSDADILCEDSILYPFLGFETLGDNEQWLYNWLGWFDLSIKKSWKMYTTKIKITMNRPYDIMNQSYHLCFDSKFCFMISLFFYGRKKDFTDVKEALVFNRNWTIMTYHFLTPWPLHHFFVSFK